MQSQKTLWDANRLGRKVPADMRRVDVVFTYVDAADPAWRARFAARTGREPPAAARVRHEPRGEIYHALRTIEAYMPWAARIYVVTDGQALDAARVSSWARARTSYVMHEDIMEPELLPTFNSMVIEAHLHRIPGLSDAFLYFNDDMFLGRALGPGDLASEYGVPYVYALQATHAIRPDAARPWLHWTKNAVDLFEGAFGVAPAVRSNHNATLLRRQGCLFTWAFFGDALRASMTPERADANVHFVYLAVAVSAFFGLCKLRVSSLDASIHATCGAATYSDALRKIWDARPLFFCINNVDDACAAEFAEFMGAYLPTLPAPNATKGGGPKPKKAAAKKK
jgi:hypothetical protein